ncbi:quinol monooxygenase YgiN [Rhodococcus sp. LBL1]|uniref:Quinol monooxygenase YgiN n=1 Tax=Prescottella agglutinans TaxID=1644129 RepID=A0ABT6MFJ5_9NOCA|nr:quinol monooxygenase YgiN [Prescottella agglutinans]MDH6676084.1 quinol monooxygenase YgiN [Rhodococcus sp. LBL1]MDH6681370.1 quinol monooxygenase YgiN [Rhodococcus sp. LBL2]
MAPPGRRLEQRKLIVYARSTTIQAHPSFIDAGIKHIRDTVMPALADIEGSAGLSLLVDRDSGRCIATSSWRDEETLRASEAPAIHLRDQAAEVFHGTAHVERWDIEVLHRDHTSRVGACVRATWFKVDPGKMMHAVDAFKLRLPGMEGADGFCSASLMVDHSAGRAVSSVTFDSVDQMRASREPAETARASFLRDAGAELLEVCEFELAIAHLHVPELV